MRLKLKFYFSSETLNKSVEKYRGGEYDIQNISKWPLFVTDVKKKPSLWIVHLKKEYNIVTICFCFEDPRNMFQARVFNFTGLHITTENTISTFEHEIKLIYGTGKRNLNFSTM